MDESESDGVDTPASDLVVLTIDVPHLTKTTWRASKHHRLIKRVHNFGGVTVAPPAFIEAAKGTRFQKGRPGHRVCSSLKKDGTTCGMLALKGMKFCLAHGGAAALARQGRYQPSGRAAAAIAAKQAKETQARSKMPEDRVPNGPSLELLRLRSTLRPTSGRACDSFARGELKAGTAWCGSSGRETIRLTAIAIADVGALAG